MNTYTETLLTKRVYWHDTYLFESSATVTETGFDEQKGYWIKVDETIIRPKGGGQPADKGFINGAAVQLIEELTREQKETQDNYDQGNIIYYFSENHAFQNGTRVDLTIDPEVRLAHSALHTAGHIIAGIMRTRYEYKQQTGANHYPEQARVEFKKDGRDIQTHELMENVLGIIDGKRRVDSRYEQAPALYHQPGRSAMTRCVSIHDLWTEPCSGTHLENTQEVKDFYIRKNRIKSGKVSIGYDAHYIKKQ